MSQVVSLADPQPGLAIHEGWLTKSPPLESQKSIFKARWRKRWVVLQHGTLSDQFLLQYYTDESKHKLKGTINLNHCMNISSNLILEAEKKAQPYMFSLSTPDRVYHFSSANKQLTQNWVEIISNACRRNIFFQGNETVKSKSVEENSKKSLKDPYIHLTECYSGEKKPPKVPPRPSKSSSDVKKQLNMNSFVNDDIEYLDLEFPSNQENDVLEEDRQEAQNETIYRNIDFIKTNAFNETRREVEENKYNFNKTIES
eukprot:GFUD01038847.1.p1 GENE.GFUD01038847.1~~GFUD01038847.1.p1  ORF type:complete len:257 (+),score=72.57 GFUD01038847.1:90-860(+)